MECAERDRLKEIFRIATRELVFALNEEWRLLKTGDSRAVEFESVVNQGTQFHREALAAYRQHIAEHGCVEAVGTA